MSNEQPPDPTPRQNRVAPDGALHATHARGTMMGNRGGRMHDPARRLAPRFQRRPWVTRAWICCRLEFRDRRRPVMGDSYTELFFLDEAVALAAGHRPCYECRRADARAYAAAFAEGHRLSAPPRAGEIDAIAHPQRIAAPETADPRALPDGAMFRDAQGEFLKLGDAALRWSWTGYAPPAPLPRNAVAALTPAAARRALSAGFSPRLHPTAQRR